MPNPIDIAGQRFGRLTAVGKVYNPDKPIAYWLARCDCGGETTTTASRLRSGHSQSCGCLQRERTGNAARTHGGTRHPLFRLWRGMMDRCTNPNHAAYEYYGGRGIRVCERWQDFNNFVEDVGARPEGLTLDRRDNDGDYGPDNHRWATMLEQSANKRPRRWWKRPALEQAA